MRWHPGLAVAGTRLPPGDADRADVALAALVQTVEGTAASSGNREMIQRSYQIAARWHRGQRRLSGDPYITHPLAVAQILADLGASPPVVCAALLHDVTEDTPCTLAQLRTQVSPEIAGLVDQVTRLDTARYSSATEVMAAAQAISDNRAVMIKLADRLHNMRTLSYVPPAKQLRKSREVLETFAPLARSLGMEPMERELVDLANSTLTASRAIQDLDKRGGRAAPGPAVSRRLLATTAVMLPSSARDRWLREWTGELSTLDTRRSRARFTIAMITGMPRLAAALHWPAPGARDGPR